MLLLPLETLVYHILCCTLPNYSFEEKDHRIKPWELWREIISRNFCPNMSYYFFFFLTEWAIKNSTAKELPMTCTQLFILGPPQSTSYGSCVNVCTLLTRQCLNSWYFAISSEFLTHSGGKGILQIYLNQIFRDWLYRSWIIQALLSPSPPHLLAFLLLISTSARDLGWGKSKWVWNSHQPIWLPANNSYVGFLGRSNLETR